jgi:hypothetical protein
MGRQMDDTSIEMMRLGAKGYACSQIMIRMALDAKGEENPDLVRAMGGLAYGCGSGCGTCGVLTGGSCLIALFAAKGSDEETASEHLMLMLNELTDWFSEIYGSQYGGITCEAIVGDEGPQSARDRCGKMVAETYNKAMEILMANDFEI